MARRTTPAKKKSGISVDLSKVGKSFEDGQDYLVKCTECTLEDGQNAPYFALKLEGTDEFEGAVMYHNASTSEKSLWRLRPLVEAFGIDIPDGPMDLAPEDFVGKFAMCSVYKDRYDGKVSMKPEDFWAAEGAEGGDDGAEGAVELDDLDDDDIKKIGKAMGIKTKIAAKIREELAEADAEELTAVMVELGLVEGEAEGEGDAEGGIDLDELDDDQIKALAEAAGIKGKIVKKLKAALAELEPEELAEAAEEAGIGGDAEGGDKVTAEAIGEMTQDELEALVEEHELEVDLDEHKTLRKKRSAVVDAAEEAGILAED